MSHNPTEWMEAHYRKYEQMFYLNKILTLAKTLLNQYAVLTALNIDQIN